MIFPDITRQGNFLPPVPGSRLVFLNLTVQRLDNNPAGINNLFSGVTVKDEAGRRYMPALALISDVPGSPGGSQGYLFYEVPENDNGLTFNYQFPDAIGVTAVYDLRV